MKAEPSLLKSRHRYYMGGKMSSVAITRFALSTLFTVQFCHGFVHIHSDGLQRISPRLFSSSDSSLLPPRAKSWKKRRKPITKETANDGVLSEEAATTPKIGLPESIPRLSDLLKEPPASVVSNKNTNNRNGFIAKNSQSSKDPAKFNSSVDGEKAEPVPWRAGFQESIRTQGRIKKAFETYSLSGRPVDRATAVLKELLATSPSHGNAANVVCALTYSAKAMGTTKTMISNDFRSTLFQTTDILHHLVRDRQLNARQLCNAAWAIAKHYDRDESIVPPPVEITALSSENVVGVAETWSLKGQSGESDEEMQQRRVDQTIDEIAKQVTSLLLETNENLSDPRLHAKVGEICMAGWAYGVLRPRQRPPGWQMPRQLGRLPGARRARADSFVTFEQWVSPSNREEEGLPHTGSQEISDRLFDAIGGALCRSPDEPSDESEQITDGPTRVRTSLEKCTWSELANLGWAFASHGSCKSVQAEMLLLGLAREASHRIRVGGAATKNVLTRDISQLVWALGTLQADNFRLADDLVVLVEALTGYLRLEGRGAVFARGRPLRRWSCPDLVQIALSLAHARIDELSLLRAVYEESSYRLMNGLHVSGRSSEGRMSFRSWEVSILLWAQARLYLTSPQGIEFDDFVADAPKCIIKALRNHGGCLSDIAIGPQEQANIAWSLTVLEEHQSPESIELLGRIFKEAADSCEEKGVIQLEHAHQLWQAYFLLEDESPEAVENVPTWFVDYLRTKWIVEKARDKLSSARHRALSQTLHLMGVDHYNEHDEDIDVAIILTGNAEWTHETSEGDENLEKVSVAVEFDGPNHFTREQDPIGNQKPTPPRALGHTVLKYRLLKKQGWSVVRVPYYEFDKIPFWASMERQRYLQRKLKTHSNIKFSEVDVSEYKAPRPNRKSRYD